MSAGQYISLAVIVLIALLLGVSFFAPIYNEQRRVRQVKEHMRRKAEQSRNM